jgi:hypothetical protein
LAYGHVEKRCFRSKAGRKQVWRPKQHQSLDAGQPAVKSTPSTATKSFFPIDPAPYIPAAFEVDEGGQDRVPRVAVILSGEPIYAHEEFILAVDADGILLQQDNEGFLQQIRSYVENDQDLRVYSTCLHPFGIGLLSLETNYQRDILMAGNPHDIDGINVHFVGHDHGFNRREHDLNAEQSPQPPPNVDQFQIQAYSESSSFEKDSSSSAQSATSQGQNQESILGRADLELFQPENPGPQPAWLGPFISVAFPHQQSGGWWLVGPSCSNNSFILLFNLSWPQTVVGLGECSAGRSSVLLQELREVSAPHKEAYGKLFAPITKTYSGKKLNKDTKKAISEDTIAKKAIKVRPAVTMKKSAGKALKAAIPDTEEGLRRSPRIKSLLDGHKKIIKATKLKLVVNPTDQGQSMPAYDSGSAAACLRFRVGCPLGGFPWTSEVSNPDATGQGKGTIPGNPNPSSAGSSSEEMWCPP